ncbi:MAG: phosphatase [Bacteroidetes bacterium]|jgi:exopolyphosphatase/guanosine-5'-triphosphate,3'-diphosphate pyrophosphatase|nr:phosphatase [Bacteroidota bacterium]
MNIAVIDLGTNTFNLLIAEVLENMPYSIVYNKKLPVKLGEGGLNNKTITPEAFQRGIDAMAQHQKVIQEKQCTKTYAFATSALRSAQNGPEFVALIREKFNISVSLITGDREAELIYYGVKQAVPLNKTPVLILDIGGGSNEFIIANDLEIFWRKSYELGIARLLGRFNPSDPITEIEIEAVRKYLKEELRLLQDKLKKYKITTLIGASGSFETFTSMLKAEDSETEVGHYPEGNTIPLADFELLHNKLIRSTSAQRHQMKGLEPMRVEMIVLAAIFVKFVIDHSNISEMKQSNFALKEGIIYELLNAI